MVHSSGHVQMGRASMSATDVIGSMIVMMDLTNKNVALVSYSHYHGNVSKRCRKMGTMSGDICITAIFSVVLSWLYSHLNPSAI